MERTSIEAAAEEVVFLERSATFAGRGCVRLGGSFALYPAASYFASPVESATVREFWLRDVVLDADSMLFFKDGQLIGETRYLQSADECERAFGAQKQVRKVETPEAVAVVSIGRRNYYHWLVQAAPAIDTALRRRDRPIRLALPPLTVWQRDTLALLGHERVPRLDLARELHYFIPDLVYNDFLSGSTNFSSSRLALATLRRMRENVRPSYVPHRWIYVARTDSPQRVAINEPALIEYLRQEGVHIVVPGSLDLADQIDLFRSTRVVIGPHGAGLSNVVFCQQGTLLYELLPARYTNACFNRLARACELDYWADIFAAEEHGPAARCRWQIDVSVVKDRMRMIRAMYS